MKRYDTYKDSGVQWLGEIPGHWGCVLIHRLFNIKAGGDVKPDFFSEIKDDNHPYPVYTNTKSANEIYAYTSVATCPGNSITVTGRGEVGHAIYREHPYDAIIRLLSLSPKKTNIVCKFYAYFIDTAIPFTSDSAAIGQLSAIQIKEKYVTLPPLSEQHSIVSYLDDKCGKIDKMVEGKQKQIELLAEMKQRIIADAVTRGLNPDVKMKATNIPWLPEIPEHWEMKRLKYLVSCNDESLTNTEDPNLEINYVEIGDVNDVKGITNMTKYRFEDAPSRARRKTRKDDVIVSTVRTYLKAIAKIPENEIIVSTGFAVLRAKDINSSYLAFCCMSNKFVDSVVAKSKGISYPAITAFELLNLYVPVPPLSEQHSIVSYITDKTTKIDTLTSNLQQEIESIKEYKQRLISDVVTGQIKVC